MSVTARSSMVSSHGGRWDHSPSTLWTKLTLAGRQAAEGYDECGAGFDGMTLSRWPGPR